LGVFGRALAATKLSGTTGLLTTVFSVLIFVVAAYMIWKRAGVFFGASAGI
jgi:hypothetical protein